MKLNNLLVRHRIEFTPIDADTTAIECPLCEGPSLHRTATFNIDTRNGRGHCSNCKQSLSFPELLEKLEIKDIDDLDSREVVLPERKTINPVIPQKYENVELEVLSVQDILSCDYGEQQWLVEGLVPLEGVAVVAGSPGHFKSWMTQEIARCVSLNLDFLGHFKVMQGAVLVADKENNIRQIQERLRALSVPEDAPIFYLRSERLKVDNKRHFDFIVKKVKEKNIKLVIFDSLVRVHSGEENDAKQMSNVLEQFKCLTACGTTVIFIHHHRKERSDQTSSAQSMRGSSDIGAFVDSAIMVKKDENHLIIQQTKSRQSEELKPFNVLVCKDENTKLMTFEYQGEHTPKSLELEEAKEEILSMFENIADKGISREEIKNTLGDTYKKNTVERAIKELLVDKIEIKAGLSNKHFFHLVIDKEE